MYNSLVWNKQTNLDILDFVLTHKSFISFLFLELFYFHLLHRHRFRRITLFVFIKLRYKLQTNRIKLLHTGNFE